MGARVAEGFDSIKSILSPATAKVPTQGLPLAPLRNGLGRRGCPRQATCRRISLRDLAALSRCTELHVQTFASALPCAGLPAQERAGASGTAETMRFGVTCDPGAARSLADNRVTAVRLALLLRREGELALPREGKLQAARIHDSHRNHVRA